MRGGACWNKFARPTFLSNERPESPPLKVSDNGSTKLHIHMKNIKYILGLVAGAALVVGATGCEKKDSGGDGGNKGGGSGSKTSSYQQLAPGGVVRHKAQQTIRRFGFKNERAVCWFGIKNQQNLGRLGIERSVIQTSKACRLETHFRKVA